MSPNVGPRTGRTQLIATRLPHELVARLDRLAARLSLPGLTVTRAEALRAAATAGLEVLERQAPELRPAAAPPAAAFNGHPPCRCGSGLPELEGSCPACFGRPVAELPPPAAPEAPAPRRKAKNAPNARKGTVAGAAQPADEAPADAEAWEGVSRLDTEAALRGDRPRRFEVRRAKGGFVATTEGSADPIGTFPTLAEAQRACLWRTNAELTWRPAKGRAVRSVR